MTNHPNTPCLKHQAFEALSVLWAEQPQLGSSAGLTGGLSCRCSSISSTFWRLKRVTGQAQTPYGLRLCAERRDQSGVIFGDQLTSPQKLVHSEPTAQPRAIPTTLQSTAPAFPKAETKGAGRGGKRRARTGLWDLMRAPLVDPFSSHTSHPGHPLLSWSLHSSFIWTQVSLPPGQVPQAPPVGCPGPQDPTKPWPPSSCPQNQSVLHSCLTSCWGTRSCDDPDQGDSRRNSGSGFDVRPAWAPPLLVPYRLGEMLDVRHMARNRHLQGPNCGRYYGYPRLYRILFFN